MYKFAYLNPSYLIPFKIIIALSSTTLYPKTTKFLSINLLEPIFMRKIIFLIGIVLMMVSCTEHDEVF